MKIPGTRKGFTLVAAGLLALSLLTTRAAVAVQTSGFYDPENCGATHFYAEAGQAVFMPLYFIQFMVPHSRIASPFLSIMAQDLKAPRYALFGSAAHSLVIDSRLADYLEAEKIIELETNGTYHFRSPWQGDKLSALGIRYVIERAGGAGPELVRQGWRPLAELSGILVLYENPEKPSLVYYLEDGRRRFIDPQDIEVRGNGLSVRLPALREQKELVVTLSARPGWKAYVNGSERKIEPGKNRLIKVLIKPGDRTLAVRYEPFKVWHFAACVLGSLLLLAGSWKAASRFRGGNAS